MSSQGRYKRQGFAAHQPRDGDYILHCGHVDGVVHFFRSKQPVKFTRPDKSFGMASWLLCCPSCFAHSNGDPTATIRGDGIWKGNKAVIMEDREPRIGGDS